MISAGIEQEGVAHLDFTTALRFGKAPGFDPIKNAAAQIGVPDALCQVGFREPDPAVLGNNEMYAQFTG